MTPINQIQFVLLCPEKDFDACGQDIVFSRLITDLKSLERADLNMPVLGNDTIRDSVVTIAGDNLGSHILGGFVKNFSTAEYFCRYCLITKTEFNENKCI